MNSKRTCKNINFLKNGCKPIQSLFEGEHFLRNLTYITTSFNFVNQTKNISNKHFPNPHQ